MRRFDSKLLSVSSSVFLRFALGISFLSAVGNRFGLWGAFGAPHVAWETFARFVAYTGQLNWFVPKANDSDPRLFWRPAPKLFWVFCCCSDGRRGPQHS